MSETGSITFRAAADLVRRLEALAATTDRSKSWHVEQALHRYLDLQGWQIAHIEQSLADMTSGNVIEHDKVATWLDSWGSAREGDAP